MYCFTTWPTRVGEESVEGYADLMRLLPLFIDTGSFARAFCYVDSITGSVRVVER